MDRNSLKLHILVAVLVSVCAVLISAGDPAAAIDTGRPNIPRVWVDSEIAALEVPLANPAGSPKHISAEYYYSIPVRPIYKSYPVYAPGHEPPGYFDRLTRQEPEIVWGTD